MGLDTVETVLWAEQEFDIDIPDEDTSSIRSVGEFTRYVHRTLQARDVSSATSEQQVFDKLKRYLVETFSVDADRVVRDAEFVRDLGLG